MEEMLLSQKKKSFGIYESALACLLFIIFNFIFIFLYGLLPVSMRSNKWVYYFASFLIEFMFALTAMSVAGMTKLNLVKASGMNKKINGKIVGLGFLISLVSLFGFANLTSVFVTFLNNCGYQSILSDMSIDSFGQYLVYVVVSCAAPAVFEELLFRGVIASGLKERGFKVAWFVSALIFMLMHGNAEQTVHQFIIGLIIGYIFIKSGNLWLGVIIHFFNNFISITQAYILTALTKNVEVVEEVEASAAAINPWIKLVVSLIMSIVFAYVGYLIIKVLIKRYLDEDKKLNNPTTVSGETTILVEGEQQQTEMSIDGIKIETSDELESKATNEEDFAENTQKTIVQDKSKGLSVSTIVMFSLSFAYLAFDWIIALLQGFGLF